MPKMSTDYLDRKRNMILDAALAVCMRKPMHEVSMRDIISECGFSQGAIYRYFSNIDDVLIGLINRECIKHDIKALTDKAVLSDNAPEKVIYEMFSIYEKAMLDNLVGIGKIYYEICVIYINDKERLNHFVTNIHFASDEGYLWENMYRFIFQKVSEGYFSPKLPLDDIMKFHVASLDGIIRDLILNAHYQIALPFPGELEKHRLICSLCAAFILLLSGDEKLVYEETSL